MPDTPIQPDDQDDGQIDRLLRDAGARMRAATEVDNLSPSRRVDGRGTRRRWVVPVAIVTATAAAIVAAVWLAGPATDTVREAPADTGLVSTPDSTPDSAVDSLPAVEPVESSAPTETAEPESTSSPNTAAPAQPAVTITEADFDRAGGMCVRLVAGTDSADACLTNRQLQDVPTWTVAFTEQAFEVTLGRLDPAGISATAIDDACGYAPSTLIPARWLNTSCESGRFWFVASPETPDGEMTTFVAPPFFGEPVALEPIDTSLPDGFVAYRTRGDDGGAVECLVIASFPDPWREACGDWSAPSPILVPAAGSVFLLEPTADLTAIEVTDIAVLSVPIAGCTAPILDMAAAIPESSVMISGLICSEDSTMVTVPSVLLQSGPVDGGGYPLERATDGTWSTVGGGTSFPCNPEPLPACTALGVDDDLMSAPLPIAPWGLVGAREHDLDPVEVTDDVRDITGGARSADEIAAAVIAEYDNRPSGEGNDPVVDSLDALGLVVVDMTLLDDSTTQARYAVWYRPTDDGELRVERAYLINVCSRGIAAPDMCV